MSPPLQVEVFVTQPFGENSLVIHHEDAPEGSPCLVVDPGFGPGELIEHVRQHKWRVQAILNTHGHLDHIAGNQGVKAAFPDAPLIIGVGDAPMLEDPAKNFSVLLMGTPVVSPPADQTVQHGETLTLLDVDWQVFEIPGHSPGHVVFYQADHDPPIVLGGDVLFAGGIGRTDFPGGSLQQLLEGIQKHLYTLPGNTVVYPGHGPSTTIEHERQTNPFVSAKS